MPDLNLYVEEMKTSVWSAVRSVELVVSFKSASRAGKVSALVPELRALLDLQKLVSVDDLYRSAFSYCYFQFEGFCRQAFRACFRESWARDPALMAAGSFRDFSRSSGAILKKIDAKLFRAKSFSVDTLRGQFSIYGGASVVCPDPEVLLVAFQSFGVESVDRLMELSGYKIDWDRFVTPTAKQLLPGMGARELASHLKRQIDSSAETRNVIVHEGGGQIPAAPTLVSDARAWMFVFADGLNGALVKI